MADEELDLFSAFDATETLTSEEKKQATATTATTTATKRKEAPTTTGTNAASSSSPPAKKQAQEPTATSNQKKPVAVAAPSSTALQVVPGKHIDATPVDGASTGAEKPEGYVATGTTQKNLISFSVYPPDYVAPRAAADAPKGAPAKTYPFTLDPFQQAAVDYIEAGESVLVSAHTSAGTRSPSRCATSSA